MDEIVLKNLKFYGYHGLYQDEKISGQTFIVDIEMKADIRAACESDSIEDTVDYSKVYEKAKHITENHRYQLVEKLAEAISQGILTDFDRVFEVTVTVKKPQAPIDGKFDWVGVKITRRRNV
ncbi:MAG TPA: dihydroneopterin aldolase [Clostridiaceae bacterium]|jgi:dihydroneopterin aldolase|nr:dihydroneopterin aldolase [Clostridiaceae bacterium]